MSEAATLAGRTALVTGATAGIGLAVARRLARAGCKVALNGLAGPEEAERLRAEIAGFGAEATLDLTDLADGAATEAMVRRVGDRLGAVDILVNNAVARVFGPIEATAPEDWRRAMAVNLDSAFHTIRAALPGMKARGWGRIVNMSSVYGFRGAANRASYVTGKTALIGLTRAVALETVESGVTCNAVCPGSVDTTRSGAEIRRAVETEGLSEAEAVARFLRGKQPAGRFVGVESVAATVAFLCGPDSADLTGATFPVDLGWTAS